VCNARLYRCIQIWGDALESSILPRDGITYRLAGYRDSCDQVQKGAGSTSFFTRQDKDKTKKKRRQDKTRQDKTRQGRQPFAFALWLVVDCRFQLYSHVTRIFFLTDPMELQHIVPMLSASLDFYVRVFVRVFNTPRIARLSSLKISNVYQCKVIHMCLHLWSIIGFHVNCSYVVYVATMQK
jgi:hypothetical protein